MLGDDASPRGDVGREQRREAGVASEDPEDADPLVRAEGRPLPVDELLGPGDRGREADAVLGPLDVVVHRLGDRYQRDPVAREHLGEAQRVVAADRHEVVEPQAVDVLEHERGQVVEVLAAGVPGGSGGRQPGRQGLAPHLARVRPRGVEPGPAGPVDRPGVGPIEVAEVVGVELRPRSSVGQALPAAADPDDVVAELGRPVDDALDDRIEPGDVAASGQDADPSGPGHGPVSPCAGVKSGPAAGRPES